MDRPPAIEDAERVVVPFEQGRQIEQGRAGQAGHHYALGGGQAAAGSDGHAEVVEEHQHHHHDDDLEGERLLQELVSRRPPEDVADHCGHAHGGPEAEVYVGERHAVELDARLLGHHVVGRAHEAGEHPDQQEVGVDDLDHVEGQNLEQGVGAEILRRGEQAEGDLQAEQQERDHEIGIGHALGVVSHLRTSS
jgi:hypothetical protein